MRGLKTSFLTLITFLCSCAHQKSFSKNIRPFNTTKCLLQNGYGASSKSEKTNLAKSFPSFCGSCYNFLLREAGWAGPFCPNDWAHHGAQEQEAMGATEASLCLGTEAAQRLRLLKTTVMCLPQMLLSAVTMHQQPQSPCSDLPSGELTLGSRADQQSPALAPLDPPWCSCRATLPRASNSQWRSRAGVLETGYSILMGPTGNFGSGNAHWPGWNFPRTMLNPSSLPLSFHSVRLAAQPEGSPCLPLLPLHCPLRYISCTVTSCIAFFSEELNWHTVWRPLLFCVYFPLFFNPMH